MRDFQQGTVSSCQLSIGKLLFFQLLSNIFSFTDLNNSIINLSIMILSQILTQCPMNTLKDTYYGLLVCYLLLKSFNSIEIKRLMPEVISYLSSILVCFIPSFSSYFPVSSSSFSSSSSAPSPAHSNNVDYVKNNVYYNREFYRKWKHSLCNNFKYSSLKNLRNELSASNLNAVSSQPRTLPFVFTSDDAMKSLNEEISFKWNYFTSVLDGDVSQDDMKEDILLTSYRLISQLIIPLYSSFSAFPELIHPIYRVLQNLLPHQNPLLSQKIQFIHCEVLSSLQQNIENSYASRVPLQWRKKDAALVVEGKTPKYHINYIIKRDREEYDNAANGGNEGGNGQNKEKLQLKQLTRQLKREQKAAMRELRRDADFIEQEKYQEKVAESERKRQERFKNYQWLEEQQATINLQVKKGGSLVKGGGSAAAKKPRVKR
jgi:hypothetical protein